MPNTYYAPFIARTARATARRKLPVGWILLAMAVVCAVVTVWVARSTAQSIYAGAMDAARGFNERVVLTDESRIRKTLSSVDTLLQVVRQDYRRNPKQALADIDLRLATLQLEGRLLPQITVVDAQGNFLATTASQDAALLAGVNVKDREYFAHQRDAVDDELQLGSSVKSRLNGQLILPITRKITDKDGRFAGLVVLTVSPTELAALDIAAPLDAQAVRALINTKGQVIVRQIGDKMEHQGDSSKSQVFTHLSVSKIGSYEATSPIDGVRRLVSYRLIEPLGLVSIASTSVSQIKTSVQGHVDQAVAWIGTIGLLAFVASASVFVYFTRRREDQARVANLSERELFLLEQLPVMFLFAWRRGDEIVVFKCNDRLLQTLECSREELLGQPVNAILLDGVDQKRMEDWLAALAQGPEARSRYKTLVSRSGKTVRVMAELTVTQVFSHDDGRGVPVQAYCMSLLDVSTADALRNALFHKEMSFKRLVDVLPDSIMTFDPAGRLTWSNQNARDYLGLNGAKQAFTIADVDRYVHPEDLPTVRDAHLRLKTESPCGQQFEVRLRRHDGMYRWFDARIVLVTDADGVVTETISAATDIEDRKKMHERNAQAQRLVTTGQLASGLAHDFNNLLAVIIGNLDLAAHSFPDAAGAQQVAVALGAAERGANLVKSMLTLAGQQVLKPVVVNLNAVVESMLPLIYQALGARVSLEVMLHAEALWVQVDTPRLEACILNLVVNARDAMPSGGRLVLQLDDALAYTREGYAQAARLSIIDSGTGMTDEVKRRALEPFFTTKERGRGTGLGLAMVAGFVHQSGGELTIHSQLGVGTTIDVMLPLTQTAAAEALGSRNRAVGALSGRVLVVDDEAELVDLITTWLTSTGLTVATASSAADAIGLLGDGSVDAPFDLVISDVVMPGHLSGFDLLEYVGDMLPSTGVLLMSGYSGEAIADPRLQAVGVLTKPFRQADLLDAVSKLLQKEALHV